MQLTKGRVVHCFQYGSMEREVEAGIGCASRFIGGMSQTILKRRELSKYTKLRVVNAMIMRVLMYGCEA